MPIVTDGLVGYWNSKQGVSGTTWSNIAPATVGKYNGVITGAIVQSDGMYFDLGNNVSVVGDSSINSADYTIEVLIKQVDTATARPIFTFDVNTTTTSATPYLGLAADNRVRLFPNGDSLVSYNKYSTDTIGVNLTQITMSYKASGGALKVYINGILDSSHTSVSASNNPMKAPFKFATRTGSSGSFKGHIAAVRVYSRVVTDVEIQQNYAVGKEVGLVVATPPVVSSIVTNRVKISDEPNANQSIITVRFDTPVTQYVARLNGSDYNTGTLVHTGGAVAANTDAQIIVDWNELTTEGSNRINVYGQNANGWTVLT